MDCSISEDERDVKAPAIAVGIDFGTYASGFAYQWRNDFLNDRLKIYCNNNWQTGASRSYKTPTVVLLKPDTSLYAFGSVAETEYSELECNGHNPAEWFLFRQFKMELYHRQITNETLLYTEDGKGLPMQLVISRCLEYMRKRFVQHLCQCGVQLPDKDVLWVITVPAIWDDAAKHMMRSAAEQAGMSNPNVLLALEPECAAIYCSQLKENHISDMLIPGSNIMVVDMGGGTVDITTVQVTMGNHMKQVYMTGGGAWGGLSVNNTFLVFIESIVGKATWKDFAVHHSHEFSEFRQHFEDKKRGVTVKSDLTEKGNGSVSFMLPFPTALKERWESYLGHSVAEEFKARTDLHGKVSFQHGRLRIDIDIIRNMFLDTTKKVVEYIHSVVKDTGHREHGIAAVVLIGGMAESPLVATHLRNDLETLGIPVRVPENPTTAVLNGAVLYGHKPSIITSRILGLTYGTSICKVFNVLEHQDAETIVIQGVRYAKNLFEVHARRGEEVKINQWIPGLIYSPLGECQVESKALIYASVNKYPKYVTEEGCKYLGYIDFEFPQENKVSEDIQFSSSDIESEMGVSARVRDTPGKCVKISLCFGGTEIRVRSVDERLGKLYTASMKME